MNKANREVIHNYAEYFSCQSESLDPEPNRNVNVTASYKSSIPSVSLLQAVGISVDQLKPKIFIKAKTVKEEQQMVANKNPPVVDYFNFDNKS